jgi:chaperonin cofactor prefoldin
LKEEITKHVNRLSKKLDAFEEQQREEHERFVEFTKEKYKKIPKWIKKIFI